MGNEGGVRLQAYLARAGLASRRACEALIAAGRVRVNGLPVTRMGTTVGEGDLVEFDGKPVRPEAARRHLALNKPPRYLCSSSDDRGRPLAIDLIAGGFAERLYNVGRLDFMSQGLILFTNDGDFAARIMHPSSGIEKVYRLECPEAIPRGLLDRFLAGIELDGVQYRLKAFEPRGPRSADLVLVEGKNREIRRVFEAAGVAIGTLTRVRIGCVDLGDLPLGAHRELSEAELRGLLALASEGVSHGRRD